MRLLAFETSTEACSVALHVDGHTIERFEIAPRRHAELSLPWAQALLDQAGVAKSQLDAIAVGRGPGAFTGVRLAIALGQGLALALDRPLLAVSTLQALALRAPAGTGRIVAAIDARMGEVYAGCFQRDGAALIALNAETVAAPDAVQLADAQGGWHAVGTGFGAAEGVLAARWSAQLASVDAAALPRASDVVALALQAYARGERPAPDLAEPAYLRNNVALTLVEQQAARAAKQQG